MMSFAFEWNLFQMPAVAFMNALGVRKYSIYHDLIETNCLQFYSYLRREAVNFANECVREFGAISTIFLFFFVFIKRSLFST